MDLLSPHASTPSPSPHHGMGVGSLASILPSPHAAGGAAAVKTEIKAGGGTAQAGVTVPHGGADLIAHFGLGKAYRKFAGKASLPASFAHYVAELPGSIVYGHSLIPASDTKTGAAAQAKSAKESAAAAAAALSAAAAGGMISTQSSDLRADGWDVDAMRVAPLLNVLVPLSPPQRAGKPPAPAPADDGGGGSRIAPQLLARALKFSSATAAQPLRLVWLFVLCAGPIIVMCSLPVIFSLFAVT